MSVESWSPVGGHTLDNVFDGQPGVCRALEPVGGGRHTLDNVFDGQPGVCRVLEPGGGGTP